MKKVLIISHEFAPSTYVGAKRMIKFAKFLPRYGWIPIILTKEIWHYKGIDATLNEDVHSDTRIYRIKEWNLTSNDKNTGDSDIYPSGKDEKSIFLGQYEKFLRKVLSPYLFYDYSWLLPTFFTGLRIIKKERIDIIFASYPWRESLIIALLLKIFTGKKLVCDFRDPWTTLPYPTTGFASRIERFIDCYLEKIILRKSDHIVTVGEVIRKDIVEIGKDSIASRISVIYNGYDEDDFTQIDNQEQVEEDMFSITYLGTWRLFISPIPFLKAVGIVLRRNSEIRETIRINFIGGAQSDIKLQHEIENTIQQEKIEKVVRAVSFKNHKEGLGYIVSSDVLLLVGGFIPEQPKIFDYRLPAKLFEYLHTGKPILALVPPNGEAAKLITEANAGEIVHPLDVKGIAEKIEEMYESYKTGTLNSKLRNNTIISRYNRERQTQVLARIFDSLLQ